MLLCFTFGSFLSRQLGDTSCVLGLFVIRDTFATVVSSGKYEAGRVLPMVTLLLMNIIELKSRQKIGVIRTPCICCLVSMVNIRWRLVSNHSSITHSIILSWRYVIGPNVRISNIIYYQAESTKMKHL